MLILPIVNKNRIMNVEIKLKSASKIRRGVKLYDTLESEIICNGQKFSESMYKDSKDYKSCVDFIRNNSILYPRNYLITTKNATDSDCYDLYEINQPPKHINNQLDNLYGRVLTDMRMETPDTNNGKYLSFEKIGLDDILTEEKIVKLQYIVRNERDTSKWQYLFEREGVADLCAIVNFIKNFDCTVVSDTTIPESSLQDTLKALEIIHTRDFKNLNKYYDMAIKNSDTYAKLSYINRLVYNEPLNLIQSSKQKSQRNFSSEVDNAY